MPIDFQCIHCMRFPFQQSTVVPVSHGLLRPFIRMRQFQALSYYSLKAIWCNVDCTFDIYVHSFASIIEWNIATKSTKNKRKCWKIQLLAWNRRNACVLYVLQWRQIKYDANFSGFVYMFCWCFENCSQMSNRRKRKELVWPVSVWTLQREKRTKITGTKSITITNISESIRMIFRVCMLVLDGCRE